ncbi:hypothetical protein PhCBS80983_g02906 [Powellomyces hirtus]|uniref:EML-like second beta-propeller domain-containing protein n=1 Tax=Powellomyces hirtus TaxID=109895 RepID=A0A507E3Z2_9FUNG|nr:hypothetical protein PhCBS80983_g02906 [Powellomyces hirtus]
MGAGLLRCLCCCSTVERSRRRTVPTNPNDAHNDGISSDDDLATSPVGTENLLDIEKELPVVVDTSAWMDELRERSNIKFLQHIEAPAAHVHEPQTIPDTTLQLENIYGYSSAAQRSNLVYLYPPTSTSRGTIIYPAGNHIVVTPGPSAIPPTEAVTDSPPLTTVSVTPPRPLFVAHINAITALAVHPDGGICASVELGPPSPVIRIWAVKNSGPNAPTASSATNTSPTKELSHGSPAAAQRRKTKSHAAPSFPPNPDSVDIATLAVVTLPKDVAHVPSMAFVKDGTILAVAANRAENAEVLIYDWRKLDICGSDTAHPVARAMCSTQLFAIVGSPWSRREFITAGINHLSFWTLDVPLLSGACTLTKRDPVLKDDGTSPVNGTSGTSRASIKRMSDLLGALVPTILCATYTKHRVLATGAVNGDITFWKGDKADVTCKAIHKGSVISMTPLPLHSLSFLSGGSDSRILIWNDSHQPVSELKFDDAVAIRSLDAGVLGGSWLGWGDALKRRASRAFGLGGVVPIDTGRFKKDEGNTESPRRSSRRPSKPLAKNKVLNADARVCVGTGDGSIWYVEIKVDGRATKTLVQESHAATTNSQLWGLAPHPRNPALLLTAGSDGFVRLWNTESHSLMSKRQLGSKLRCCNWDAVGKHIAVGTDDGTVHILTPEIQGTVAVISQRRDTIHDVKYSPNNKHLAVATHESVIDVYLVDGADQPYQRIMCCRGHSSYVLAVDWSRDSLRLQSNSGNSEIMFWTMTTHPPPPPMLFADVEWATTTCPLSWASKGCYNHGVKAINERLGGMEPAMRNNWLRKLLASHEHRAALFETNGCVLGLRDVTCTARGIPADRSSPHPLLLLGTHRGDIHMLRYPAFQEGAPAYTWTPHAGPVGRIAFSCDARHVYSVGARDGCLVQHKMLDAAVEMRSVRPIEAELWNTKSLANLL